MRSCDGRTGAIGPSRPTRPAMTQEEAVAHLIASDPRFELTEAEICGVSYRVFRNAPPNLRAFLQSAAAGYGDDGEVLVFQDERWSYSRFVAEVRQLANAMTDELGIRPGDRVALAMRNYSELPVLILAAASAGAIAVPMNGWWSEPEFAYALEDCGAKAVFADEGRYGRIAPSAARLGLPLVAVRGAAGPLRYEALRDRAGSAWPSCAIDPDDDFAILYSSGSTGRPKGVVLTHRSAISAVYSWLLWRELGPLVSGLAAPTQPPSWLITTPLFHVTALQANFLLGLAAGAKLILLYKWDAEEAVRIIETERVTRISGVPTQSADLLEAACRLGAKLETLQQIGSGGAKRPAAQVGQLAQAFPGAVVSTGWGMTETNALGIMLAGDDYLAHPDAAGRPTPPLQEMRIVDATGREVPCGEVGELIVKSPANMRCYLNQPEATAEVLRDGWLHTGDLARMDENGLIYIVDRIKNIIIRGGENVATLEVEDALHQHPDVLEACVFPVPDERLGELVGAAVRLRPGSAVIDGRQLAEYLAGRLAHFKVPERIWLWTEPLPRGATGKLDRRALQQLCLAGGPPR